MVGAVGGGEERADEARERRGLPLRVGQRRGERGGEGGGDGDDEVVAERVVGGEGEEGREEEREVARGRGRREEVVVDEGEQERLEVGGEVAAGER